MAACPQCGRESPEEFTFCPACGGPLAPSVSAQEVRKVVTVLFCDLTGSTAMGEGTDPEALRRLMNRYYETARGVLERHGGTVEKFVGDAVMAVFGIPVSTEEDALRAVRSAVELREVVHGLGLEARIGVNTGAVVAGEGGTLVTGDAVNVAARLEQAAGAGEVLLGEDTLRLVRDAVSTEPLELTLKGKSGVVTAHRLLALDREATGVARHLDRPLVGRRRERDRLSGDFEDVVAARTCRLFTLIGPAGIGKSRLVADFLDRVGGSAIVARGRALSYGEGITYWPLVEVLIQLGVEPSEAIRSSPAETQLATRALLEQRAAERPLVLVIDDLQWAEGPMLDLVEHVADWSRAAPIFLLCIARPELLDVRPGWGGGKLNATSILLEPLAGEEAGELAADLLAGIDLDEDTRQRILDTAEGNPLFLEEMAALAREARGSVDVPPTIRALLQARLDTLNDGERAVIQRGAVEGQVFHRGSVTALAPVAPPVDVPQQLVALVRKELVRPDHALIAGDDAFRFRHLLIRDAAYEGLPKAVRAELHERFADWIDAHARLVEQDEILGYHLEQAARYREELDPDDPAATTIAQRAAERLGGAGHAALDRGDLHAAVNLLRRAVALATDESDRRRLIPDLADALIDGRTDFDEVVALLAELERGDRHDRALATVLRVRNDPNGPLEDVLAELDAAEAVLRAADDTIGLARCASARGWVYFTACRMGDAHRAFADANTLLRSVGSGILQQDVISGMCVTAVFSGVTVSDFRRFLDELEAQAAEAGTLLAATVRTVRARVDYGTGGGSLEAVKATADAQVALMEQTGSIGGVLNVRIFELIAVPWLEGDLAATVAGLWTRVEHTTVQGTHLYYANALAEWAIGLCELGEFERALPVLREARELADPNDVADQISLDAGEAYALALAGERERALELVERVRARAATTDMLVPLWDHRLVEARVRTVLGEIDAARALLEELVELHAARGFVRFADRYRQELAALEARGRD